jgi:hypothetical protein
MTDSELYSRLLLPKRLGFPLFNPEPYPNEPSDGIQIGDVGTLTKEGSFDFCFNVLSPADSRRNRLGVPPDFQPLVLPPDAITVSRLPVGYSISNATVAFQYPDDHSETVLRETWQGETGNKDMQVPLHTYFGVSHVSLQTFAVQGSRGRRIYSLKLFGNRHTDTARWGGHLRPASHDHVS